MNKYGNLQSIKLKTVGKFGMRLQKKKNWMI